MVRSVVVWLALAAVLAASPALAGPELNRWKAEAARVSIVRDDWGIAHVHGHSDADAIFGAVYAQAEDDFHRIEENYLTALGRQSEAVGKSALMQDLRARLYGDLGDLRASYEQSPPALRALMRAWADGLNYYLYTHPKTRPAVLRRFKPWMALSFAEGSIGGDIERIPLSSLADFYDAPQPALAAEERLALERDPTGSNGIAIAPKNTQDGHALLLINPHTSYYFRAELQMTSDEGLNAYGAATWGQFFLYQGFNDRLGWMHTSSQSDATDQFVETIVQQDGKPFYKYGAELRPLTTTPITLRYRTPSGHMKFAVYTVYKTHHGPIVAKRPDGTWVAEAMMWAPTQALEQSFSLTKARTWAEYMKAMELKANTSNNTVYADADGNIAYLHPQFIPRRDDRFDYSQPVDGADPATDWHGLHALSEAPHLLNPPTGWIQNTNDAPYTAAGPASPRAADFPRYMGLGENMRGVHAVELLTGRRDFTLEGLRVAAFDSRLPGFDALIPRLLDAYEHVPAADPMKSKLADQIAVLRGWDRRWSAGSVATSLAVYWGEALWRGAGRRARGGLLDDYSWIASNTTPDDLIKALAAATDTLTADFGDWRTPWGEINRFQRRNDDLVQVPSDAAPSLPVAFTSAHWGSLAAIDGEGYPGVKKRYGDRGNSFVAVVEFGPKVRALAISAGGESGDPASPHFADQAARFATGDLREVYFYPEQLIGHTARTYHPGE